MLSLPRAWVQPLAGELRSRKLHGAANQQQQKINYIFKLTLQTQIKYKLNYPNGYNN